MKHHTVRALAIVLVAFSTACGLRGAKIADLQRQPGRYQNRTVSVDGVVTSSWDVGFLPFAYYQVDDGTGQIAVLSQGRRTPGRGEHVRVTGRVSDVAVLGGRRIGLHLREQDLDVRR
jgi:hypothetical protein